MNCNLLAKTLGTTALVCSFSVAAQAADLPSSKEPLAPPPVAETFLPFFVKGGFTYAINESRSKLYTPRGDTGLNATISDVATFGYEFGWFVTKNISINVSGGIPLTATDKTKGTYPFLPSGTNLTTLLPALVPITVVYHLDNFGAFQPYAGVGVAPGFSFENKNAYLRDVRVSGALNTVVKFGFDYMLNQHWGVSFDVTKAFAYLEGRGIVNSGPYRNVTVVQHAHFNPWLLSTAIVYRFGLSDIGLGSEVVAKY
ncbi:outer membrane protein [Rhodoblastus sphagnicola]|uniref:OmpW/AlkL family protein n=1 Tax=Rhodoblastus sphagnicola TaxID=333368 RepID=UPI001304F917|nr:OmpW family outer membrane protein [Rhodoblastus sphagnicola]MBB4197246.1 outer membrane protein [Rhodoblastus sphagnicola]